MLPYCRRKFSISKFMSHVALRMLKLVLNSYHFAQWFPHWPAQNDA